MQEAVSSNGKLGTAFVAEIRKPLQEPVCKHKEPYGNTDLSNERSGVKRAMRNMVVDIERLENRLSAWKRD